MLPPLAWRGSGAAPAGSMYKETVLCVSAPSPSEERGGSEARSELRGAVLAEMAQNNGGWRNLG